MALRTDPSITRSKEEAKARAESLRKQIVDGGKDFATITRENSDSPSKTKDKSTIVCGGGDSESVVVVE